jgi:hypothetical protein
MDTNRKIKLVAVGVAAAAAGGTGAALGAGGGSPGTQSPRAPVFVTAHEGYGHFGDDLGTAATYLGLTEAELRTQLESGKTLAQIANATSGKSATGLIAALVAAEKQELASAVASGKLTQAQADAMSANLQQRLTDLVNGAFPKGGPGFGFHVGGLDAAATYLGLTADQLRTQLESGKTLAQIANATSGKSAAGLIAALVADAKKDIAAAVSAGKLTQAQADTITSDLQQRITDLVNGTLPTRGPGFGGPGFGFHVHVGGLDAAASYLGLTEAQLQAQLESGKTLAQIANATSGKSAAGLIAALVAAEKQQLAAAVAAGRLTQAQADAMAADIQQRITDLVNGTLPSPPRWGRFRGGLMQAPATGANA